MDGDSTEAIRHRAGDSSSCWDMFFLYFFFLFQEIQLLLQNHQFSAFCVFFAAQHKRSVLFAVQFSSGIAMRCQLHQLEFYIILYNSIGFTRIIILLGCTASPKLFLHRQAYRLDLYIKSCVILCCISRLFLKIKNIC